jgi:hypothetical protein
MPQSCPLPAADRFREEDAGASLANLYARAYVTSLVHFLKDGSGELPAVCVARLPRRRLPRGVCLRCGATLGANAELDVLKLAEQQHACQKGQA